MSDLDDLPTCDRLELVNRWRKAFSSTPTKHSSSLFLQKVLAHHMQCKTLGDVPRRTEKVLRAALRSAPEPRSGGVAPTYISISSSDRRIACNVDSDAKPTSGPRVPVTLSPGIQLVREWNGRAWQVDVLEDGFVCNGKPYRSLSAIARMITGTRWSGPRFFGLHR